MQTKAPDVEFERGFSGLRGERSDNRDFGNNLIEPDRPDFSSEIRFRAVIHFAGRNVDLQPLQVKIAHTPRTAEKSPDGRAQGKSFHGDQRRQILAAAKMK